MNWQLLIIIVYFAMTLLVMPFQTGMPAIEMFDQWRKDVMMYLFLPFVMWNVMKDDPTSVRLFRNSVLLGMVIAVVLLVFVYKAIIITGKKLPLKPFFYATSILMFVMVVAFVGGGISEFVDAGWILPKVIDGVPTISLLGIYPYAQSLIAQGIALLVVLLSLLTGAVISKKAQK